jgi:hypothetical protein
MPGPLAKGGPTAAAPVTQCPLPQGPSHQCPYAITAVYASHPTGRSDTPSRAGEESYTMLPDFHDVVHRGTKSK